MPQGVEALQTNGCDEGIADIQIAFDLAGLVHPEEDLPGFGKALLQLGGDLFDAH